MTGTKRATHPLSIFFYFLSRRVCLPSRTVLAQRNSATRAQDRTRRPLTTGVAPALQRSPLQQFISQSASPTPLSLTCSHDFRIVVFAMSQAYLVLQPRVKLLIEIPLTLYSMDHLMHLGKINPAADQRQTSHFNLKPAM